MPDTDPLSDLRRQLAIAMGPTAAMRSTPWVDPLPMRKVLRDVERHFDTIEAIPRQDTLLTAVQSFLKPGHVASFKELKYTCYGVSLAVDDKRSRLVDRPQALRRLLAQVDGERGEDRRFVRCYQALLQSYFAFTAAPDDSATQLQAQPSFLELRGFLSDRLEIVARPIHGRVAGWAITLQEHRNLLTETPCQRYTDELAQGRTDQLAQVCKGLGISGESWVWQEVILAYLRDVCQRDDRGFKQSLDQALDLSDGQTALKPNPATSRTVVAQVVKRYSEATEKPELSRLRDASIQQIGNPWLRRPAWDAWVRHEPARQMVDGWLKSKLMEDFFTLLSDEGGGAVDRRRLTYWLKYVNVIEDMWFMLGSDAYHAHSADFVQMRGRMKGRLKSMTGGPPQNNAFVMRIGGHQFIEFGSTGNACYIYAHESMKFNEQEGTIALSTLKQGSDRLTHRGSWEWYFDQRMRAIFGRNILRDRPNPPPPIAAAPAPAPMAPSEPAPETVHSHSLAQVPILSAPAPVPRQVIAPDMASFLAACREAGIDCRMDGSVVWLSEDARKIPHIAGELAQRGFFRYGNDPSRAGYWHEGKKTLPQTPILPTPAPVPKQVIAPDMASFLAACREAGIDCRMDGSVAWVSEDARKIPHIAGELAQRGFFRYGNDPSRAGFWHEGNETPAKSTLSSVPASKHVRAPDIGGLQAACREAGIQCQLVSEGTATVWLSTDATKIPHLSVQMAQLGLTQVAMPLRVGYWFGKNAAPTIAPSHPTPAIAIRLLQVAGIPDFLDACREAGIECKLKRYGPATIWMSQDASTIPHLAVELAKLGLMHFKTLVGDGFWFGTKKDEAATAPSKLGGIPGFLDACREAGIECKLEMNGQATVWMSQDASTVPHLAVELVKLRLTRVENLSGDGFWFGENETSAIAPSHPDPLLAFRRAGGIPGFLDACREAGIECKLEWNGPATIWMSQDASTIPHLAVELEELGLTRVENLSGDGFWFGTKEKAGTAPSPPVQQPAIRSAAMTAQLESVFHRCKRLNILYEDHGDSQLRIWIHENAGEWPTLERTIQSMGFKLVVLGDATGYWLGTPVSLSSPPTTQRPGASDSDIAATLVACDKLDIKFMDLRDQGGNLWIYTNATSSPKIAERLELQGFHYSDKKAAYWLPGSE